MPDIKKLFKKSSKNDLNGEDINNNIDILENNIKTNNNIINNNNLIMTNKEKKIKKNNKNIVNNKSLKMNTNNLETSNLFDSGAIDSLIINFIENKGIDGLKNIFKKHILNKFETAEKEIKEENEKILKIFDKNLKNNSEILEIIKLIIQKYEKLKNIDFYNGILSNNEIEDIRNEKLNSLSSSISIIIGEYKNSLERELSLLDELDYFNLQDKYENNNLDRNELIKQNIKEDKNKENNTNFEKINNNVDDFNNKDDDYIDEENDYDDYDIDEKEYDDNNKNIDDNKNYDYINKKNNENDEINNFYMNDKDLEEDLEEELEEKLEEKLEEDLEEELKEDLEEELEENLEEELEENLEENLEKDFLQKNNINDIKKVNQENKKENLDIDDFLKKEINIEKNNLKENLNDKTILNDNNKTVLNNKNEIIDNDFNINEFLKSLDELGNEQVNIMVDNKNNNIKNDNLLNNNLNIQYDEEEEIVIKI